MSVTKGQQVLSYLNAAAPYFYIFKNPWGGIEHGWTRHFYHDMLNKFDQYVVFNRNREVIRQKDGFELVLHAQTLEEFKNVCGDLS